MQRQLAQPKHGNVGDLARLLQPRIGDVADQKRIEPLAHGAMHVLQNLAGLEIFQITILIACTTDLGDTRYVDFAIRIAHMVQDAAQDPRITSPLALSRHALVPELHAGFQFNCPASQPRSSVSVDALAIVAAVLVVASGAATSRTFSDDPTVCTGRPRQHQLPLAAITKPSPPA